MLEIVLNLYLVDILFSKKILYKTFHIFFLLIKIFLLNKKSYLKYFYYVNGINKNMKKEDTNLME